MTSARTPDMVDERGVTCIPLDVRKARMDDIAALLELINGYAARGIMLPRTEFEISENIRDFSVAFSDKKLVGSGALHFHSPTVGEIRSLAADEATRNLGVGRAIVEALIAEANQYSLDAVFAFTYVPEFFRKMGLVEVERGELPLKAWKDCLRCPKFQCCDEIAMIRVLREEHWKDHSHQTDFIHSAGADLALLPKIELRQLPTNMHVLPPIGLPSSSPK